VHQIANILSSRRVRACDAIAFPRVFRLSLVWLGWNYALLALVEIWVIRHVLLILHRDVAPHLLALSQRGLPTESGMTWRVFVSIAIQIHGSFLFFPTKLHLSSALASRQ
jgi:hypothetical protein